MSNLKMAKAASCQSRVITYLPSLRALLQRLRGGPATPSSLSTIIRPPHASPASKSHPQMAGRPTVMTAPSNVFVSNPTLPLPGDGAFVQGNDRPVVTSASISEVGMQQSLGMLSAIETESETVHHPVSRSETAVECTLQECPAFLQRSFMELFPDAPDPGHNLLTIMTLSQRTRNDMTAWSPAIETERDELLEHFFEAAKCICGMLTASGYWADFIDPSCGRAFYGSYTSSTLFETDDRFRYFGFEILDLGCCKCISHHLWGSFAYVGAIFTNARADTPVLKELASIQ